MSAHMHETRREVEVMAGEGVLDSADTSSALGGD